MKERNKQDLQISPGSSSFIFFHPIISRLNSEFKKKKVNWIDTIIQINPIFFYIRSVGHITELNPTCGHNIYPYLTSTIMRRLQLPLLELGTLPHNHHVTRLYQICALFFLIHRFVHFWDKSRYALKIIEFINYILMLFGYFSLWLKPWFGWKYLDLEVNLKTKKKTALFKETG